MPIRLCNPTVAAKHRWIKPFLWSQNFSSYPIGGVNPGRIFLNLFEIAEPTSIDAIGIYNFATVAGNAYVGIYGPLITEETALNSTLIASSANTALAGTNRIQIISLSAAITLPVGRYYVAVTFSDITHTTGQFTSLVNNIGFTYRYEPGAYAALPNPYPDATEISTTLFYILRCVV